MPDESGGSPIGEVHPEGQIADMGALPAKKTISVITPTLNEADNIRPCYDAVKLVFETQIPGYDFEHIFSDNASTDTTMDELRQLASADRRVKVIANSRNFGAEASMFNALHRTKGDAVVVMIPADLQDPPALIAEFVKNWEAGHAVVYGIRRRREEAWLMRFMRKGFYWAVNRMSQFYIPPDVGEFQLIDRAVVSALRTFRDARPYLRGMIASCGFPAIGIEYDVQERKRGKSTMNLLRLVDQGLNGLISFSTLPLRLCMTIGFVVAAISLVYALVAFIVSAIYFRDLAPAGIPTLIVALFFFGGVQLFFLGLLGEYVLAIHLQVRGRPLVIESETINFD